MDDSEWCVVGTRPSDEALQMETVLQKLNASKLISDPCLHSGLELVNVVSDHPEQRRCLCRFINDLDKSLSQNQESGEETPPSCLGMLYNSSKAKVFTAVSGETFGAFKYLKNKLKSKVDVVLQPQNCDVVVLFCPISSRAGSDVRAALRDMPELAKTKPVILVLMHHTRDIYHPDDDFNWSDEHSAVRSHVNILFHDSQKGLLTCQKNDRAIHSLLEQCMKYKK